MANIKRKYSDFIVKEKLSIKPEKKGKYVLALLKKQGTNTLDALEDISKKLKVSIDKIGRCGLKDKNAITYQYITIPKDKYKDIKTKNYALRFIGYLNKSLSPKDLKSNYFEIIVRNLNSQEKRNFEERKNIVLNFGFANYYGKQRFLAYKEKTFFIPDLEKGNIKKVFEKILNNRKLKIKKWYCKILEAYKKENLNINLIPKSEIEMQYSILYALEFNKKLSKLIKENYLKKAYLHSKIGKLYFPLEEKLKIPAFLELYDNFHKKYFKRQTIVKPENFKYTYLDENTLKLYFELPKGAYATTLLSFLFHAVKEK